jgi:DNA-binding Lrp family transcriptional regulator
MKAFVLVSLNNVPVRRFINELKSYNQVQNAHFIFGEWDIIAEMEFPNAEELASFVMEKIRTRDDVKLTSSLIVAGM